MAKTRNVAQKRQDISRFVVHLTRDLVPDDEKKNARHNLMRMLLDGKIEARNPHCYHNHRMKELPEETQNEFNVVCFTEAPLDQLHHLTGAIEGRKVILQPYGMVFRKEFLLEKGAHPAIYMNGYDGNNWLKHAARDLFNELKSNGKQNRAVRFLPFLNAMQESYDFSWEREWRVLSDFNFSTPKDVVAVILPEGKEEKMRDALAEVGVTVVSPGWTYEQIADELATQQSIAKAAFKAKLKAVEDAVNE